MDALIKRLREGLLSMGTSEDGEIDLYDIDDAYQVMDEAADALAEARRDLANECERRDDIIASETHLRKEAEAELAEARAQIAAKDAALDALDEAHQITQQNLWRDITELRASLAGKEQEHQDFRLQNDAEWRAKLDHLKAQIAAKDAQIKELKDALRRSDGRHDSEAQD
jgi:chromosome segregation ATPase